MKLVRTCITKNILTLDSLVKQPTTARQLTQKSNSCMQKYGSRKLGRTCIANITQLYSITAYNLLCTSVMLTRTGPTRTRTRTRIRATRTRTWRTRTRNKKKTSTTLVFQNCVTKCLPKNIEIQNNTVSNHDQYSVYSTTFVAICQSKTRTSKGLYHKDKDKDQIHKDKD